MARSRVESQKLQTQDDPVLDSAPWSRMSLTTIDRGQHPKSKGVTVQLSAPRIVWAGVGEAHLEKRPRTDHRIMESIT